MPDGSLAALDVGWRRTLVASGILAALALVVTATVGIPVAGACIALGLGLGVWNAHRMHQSARKVVDVEGIDKRALAVSGMRRLGYVTAVAVVVAVGIRPHGWTVVVGLALFQIVLVASTAGRLVREVRRL